MSAKTELEVVATFDGLYLVPVVALERGVELCRLEDAKRLLAERMAERSAELGRAKEGWSRVNDRALKAELERNQLRAQLAAALEQSPPVLEIVPAPPTAEQLDTSMLVAALKPFADAFEALGIQSYAGADDEFVAFLDRNEITPAHGITMRQFRQAWEVLSGKCARHHHQPR